MTSGSQFRSAAPPEFGSAAFNTDLAEVVTMTQNLTPAQHAIALKWDQSAGTPTPIGLWNSTAASYVAAHQLDERAATEVFSVMHAAVLDALIGCWDSKYHYWLLRPSQASSAVALALPLPNFPAYPSGHSCASAAAGRVLSHVFPEHTGALNAAVIEAGVSRIYAGIHYRFDVTAGQTLGRAVADLALARGAL
jgi:membrane-associated phospholipid phosphatase